MTTNPSKFRSTEQATPADREGPSSSRFLLALALGTLAGSACAQATVEVYGRLDASVQQLSQSTTAKTRLNEGVGATSHIGFRGMEDLGGGMAAFFDLESKVLVDTGGAGAGIASGTNLNTGATGFFSRNAYVGVKGGFGSATFGRSSPGGIRAISNATAIVSGINTGLAGNIVLQGLTNDFWNNNMIKYETDTYGGFSGSFNYALGEVAGSNNQGKGWGATVFWRGSGFSLAASRQEDTAQNNSSTLNWTVLSASYTNGPFKVAGGIDRVSNPANIAGWVDSKMWTLGGSYAISPAITFAAQYFNLNDTATGTSSKQVVFNGVYAFSKRTNMYVMATRTDNGKLAVMPLYSTAGTAFTKTNGLAIGMQHLF